MRIGDIEYTRRVQMSHGAASASTIQDLQFALGIKIRPLLTRIGVFVDGASGVTNGTGVFFENGQNQPAGVSVAVMLANVNLHPIWFQDTALVTSGMGMTFPFETTWWKILLPDVRLHFGSSVLTASGCVVTLHYRFAEMTDDEIIEIAAQRAQS